MTTKSTLSILIAIAALNFSVKAGEDRITTLEDYNAKLPFWGVSWSPGAASVNGYYPSFYTGFAPRSEFPERIHVRTSRGNQTRLTVTLDDQTILDYLFDLVGRESFYLKATQGSKAKLNIKPSGASYLPQLNYFSQVLDSDTYEIRKTVQNALDKKISKEDLYKKSILSLEKLNPGRVFKIEINLKNEFLRWKQQILQSGQSITNNPKTILAAINSLVWGRINYIGKPSAEVMSKLNLAISLAQQNASDEQFVAASFDLFKAVTGNRYQFQVLNLNGQFVPALKCDTNSCLLRTYELTAIYPTGSVMESTQDEFGNKIHSFATPGLWSFIERPGRYDVDHIRNEPYYGFAPKMDFEAIGNGFHNPAVRFWGPSKATKQALGIQNNHDTLWAVKRGDVSHGCLRLALGHLWEMRQIFPVESKKMSQIYFFGNQAQDFDVFDIDGDGKLEVMGVQYFISYGLKGTDDATRREGANLQINGDKQREFYEDLYGVRGSVFTNEGGRISFHNPKVSMQSYLDYQKKGVAIRMTLNGDYPLYEQAYERDKVQFYALPGMNKDMIRLMGRVRACSPYSNPNTCGQASFESEAKGFIP